MRCGEYYKIGRSKNPEGRLTTLDVGPIPVHIVHQIMTDDPKWLEKRFHRRYREQHVRGEWFALSPRDVAEITTISVCNRPPLLVRARKPRRRRGWRAGKDGRIMVSRRFDRKLWEEFREYVASLEYPSTDTAVLEVWIRRGLDDAKRKRKE